MTTPTILTIGHSKHSVQTLVELLNGKAVEVVIDVRSQPYSRFNPDFNRESLSECLKKQRISYLFLGRELGARSSDPSCYERGRVQYRRLAATKLFQDGLRRVIESAQAQRVALLCAEKEPLACHRTILVGRELEAAGVPVAHIHADGTLESNSDALTRLIRMVGLPEEDLFRTRDELIADAYAAQEERIAFVKDDVRVGAD